MTDYTMHRRGSTTGAATGRRRSWAAGETIRAPTGEFEHLPDRMYTARVVNTSRPTPTPSADASARYVVGEKSHGWWPVIDTDTGEQVDGESARSRDDAQANADALNASD